LRSRAKREASPDPVFVDLAGLELSPKERTGARVRILEAIENSDAERAENYVSKGYLVLIDVSKAESKNALSRVMRAAAKSIDCSYYAVTEDLFLMAPQNCKVEKVRVRRKKDG